MRRFAWEELAPAAPSDSLDPNQTLVLACAGVRYPQLHRAVPALRRPGAEVPAPGEADALALRAFLALGASELVVYGHLECPVLSRALREPSPAGPGVRRALEILERYYEAQALDERARREVLVQEATLVQCERLADHPELREALSAGRLRLHAWVYEPGVGTWRYEVGHEQFVRHPRPWRVSRAEPRWACA